MRPLHIVLPSGFEFTLRLRHLFCLIALFVAAGLLATYVDLLHESVARGSQFSVAAPANRHVETVVVRFPGRQPFLAPVVPAALRTKAPAPSRAQTTRVSVNSDAGLPSQTSQ
jgi:hypothetical protein